jgi:putative tryptophan/tyrosine transport system substrate-binding protein
MVPSAGRVGILRNADGQGTSLREYQTAARTLKIQLQPLEVRAPSPDFAAAFQVATKGRVNAVITISDGLTLSYPKQISEFALKSRLPSMFENKVYPEAGGVASYSCHMASIPTTCTGAPRFTLIRFSKVQSLLTFPSSSQRSLNSSSILKAAKQIGLTIPPNVLARPDRKVNEIITPRALTVKIVSALQTAPPERFTQPGVLSLAQVEFRPWALDGDLRHTNSVKLRNDRL